MIPDVEKAFRAGSCAKNTALIQAGSEAGNMNQGLVPVGFFAFEAALSALVNGRFLPIGRRNPWLAALRARDRPRIMIAPDHECSGFRRPFTCRLAMAS
jgi:hypothetical protein